MHITGEGYKVVLLCFRKQIKYHVVVEWCNLTILSNGDANVDDKGNMDSHPVPSNATVEIVFV